MSDLLDTQGVADVLAIAPDTVRWHRKKGNLPKEDLVLGGSPLWKRSTIEEWDTARNTVTRVALATPPTINK